MAHRLGLGEPTGVDVPGEIEGLIPDRAWRSEVAERERRCRKRRGISLSAT